MINEGRHFLIIGGTSGTGKELVNIITKNELNQVSVFGRTTATDRDTANCMHYAVNVTDHDGVFNCIRTAVQHFGKLSSVVFLQRHKSRADEFDTDIAVGIGATKTIIDFLVAYRQFRETTSTNSIVIVSSIADYYIAHEQPVGYHVAKAGLVQLARYYALVLGSLGIRVNCVSPCVVAKKEAAEFYKKNPSIPDKFKKYIPLQRMGTSADIANAILFLSGSGAEYITGQNLVVDGGLTLRSHESLVRDTL